MSRRREKGSRNCHISGRQFINRLLVRLAVIVWLSSRPLSKCTTTKCPAKSRGAVPPGPTGSLREQGPAKMQGHAGSIRPAVVQGATGPFGILYQEGQFSQLEILDLLEKWETGQAGDTGPIR